MIIRVSRNTVVLEDADNFRAFSVETSEPESAFEAIRDRHPSVLTFDGPGTAWVSIAALEGWAGMEAQAAWRPGLAAMIAKAAPHGWIDAERGAIRAHVVWGVAPG